MGWAVIVNKKEERKPAGFHNAGETSKRRPDLRPGATKRERYLNRLGIVPGKDPFITPVAELEMDRVEHVAEFFAYYSPPETTEHEQLTLEILRRPQHSVIYGKPGDGKTSLRFALDASLRIRPNQTLALTYVINEDLPGILSPDQHGTRLAQNLAMDLVLQLIEQAGQGIYPDGWWTEESRLAALARQVRYGGQKLARFLRTILSQAGKNGQASAFPDPNPWRARLGLGKYWKQVSRHPVQYVALNQAVRQALEYALGQAASLPTGASGFEAFLQGVEDARLWGFERVYVIVDGLDSRLRERAQMLGLVLPLLERIPLDTPQNIYYKFYIPSEIKLDVESWCKTNLPAGLYSNCMFATIIWTQTALRQLLIQRFRASGSQVILSLDELSGLGLENDLEQKLIEMANGSPRRLLELFSRLIEAHAERAPEQIEIDSADFQKIQADALLLSPNE